jgi:hypothetical protein
MKQRWYHLLCLLLLLAGATSQLALAANGKIAGVIRDAASKEAIPGANVLIVGTTMGGAADAQGRYFILNVPPGTYTLQISAVGYARTRVEGVTVVLEQTKEVNVDLRSETVQLSEVVISAERRVVDVNRTSTKTTITSDEIESLPTMNVIDLLNSTPSAYKGFVRGGRIEETKTVVDGVDITNQLYSFAVDNSNQGIIRSSGSVVRPVQSSQLSTTTDINMMGIEQFSLNTGATGAENPSATAGTINYSLKEGSGPLSGSVNARLSQFGGLSHGGPDVYNLDYIYFADEATTNSRLATNRHARDSIVGAGGTPSAGLLANVVSDSIRSGKYVYTPGRYINQDHPLMDIQGSLGGSLSEDWRMYLTGRWYDSHGYFPNERNREADITLKSSYNLTNTIKLSGFGILNDKGKLFGWKNTAYADQTRYFLEGTPQNDGLNYVGSLKLTHFLSHATFYEVQLSQVYQNTRMGYTDGNGDGYCSLGEDGDFLQMNTPEEIAKYISQSGQDLGKFFRIGDEAGPSQINAPMCIGNTQAYISRPQFYYENSKMISNTLKGDLTSQVDFHHQLKAGFQLMYLDIGSVRRISMLGSDATDTRGRVMVDQYEFYPTQMGAYAADRMEFGGLVLNLGLRVERWDPRAADFVNYFNPAYADTVDYDGQLRRSNVERRGGDVDPIWFVSPRIGVSHPISENAALFYSYSRQAIPPPYSRLYASYHFVFGAITSFPNFVSVNQDLTRSSNYEIGAQWEFLPGVLGLNFTAYMRDVENYSYQAATVTLPSGQSTWWFNTQYADARGVELTFQAARQHYLDFLTLGGRLSYAYTYIKASSWAGLDNTMVTTFSAADSLKYNNKLPFGDFVYYNKVQNDVSGGQSTLTGGYDRTHRITYSLTCEFPEDIILSSLGTFQSGFFYPVFFPSDSRVAGRKLANAPWNKMVDLRLEKGIHFSNMRLAIFAEVKNLFNWTNIIGYDNTQSGYQIWEASNASTNGTTLTPTDTGPDPTGTYKRALGQDGSWFYDIPREYYFGVRLDF